MVPIYTINIVETEFIYKFLHIGSKLFATNSIAFHGKIVIISAKIFIRDDDAVSMISQPPPPRGPELKFISCSLFMYIAHCSAARRFIIFCIRAK